MVCNLKLGRRKAVLSVSNKSSVQPDVKRGFHSLKGKEYPLPHQIFCKCELFHIAPDRVIHMGDMRRTKLLYTIPRIHCVILASVISLQLNMRRDLNFPEAAAIEGELIEVLLSGSGAGGKREFPDSIERLPERHCRIRQRLGFLFIEAVAGMGGEPVDLKYLRIFQPVQRRPF